MRIRKRLFLGKCTVVSENVIQLSRRNDTISSGQRIKDGMVVYGKGEYKHIGYPKLPDTHVIFICVFDPVGAGLYGYSYEMICRETGIELDDGTLTIFLSTKGKNKDAVPPELVSFLAYVGDSSTRERSEDSFVRSLVTQISTIKRNRDWRSKYSCWN